MERGVYKNVIIFLCVLNQKSSSNILGHPVQKNVLWILRYIKFHFIQLLSFFHAWNILPRSWHVWIFPVGPLDVKILGSNQPLSAGRRYDLLCQSSGSRPPASITWWKSGQRFERTNHTVRIYTQKFAIFLCYTPITLWINIWYFR